MVYPERVSIASVAPEDRVKLASQLIVAIATVGEEALRVRTECRDLLPIDIDDYMVARAFAKDSMQGRLENRVTHFELTQGALPLTEQEQAMVDFVGTVIEQNKSFAEATQPKIDRVLALNGHQENVLEAS